MGQKVPDNLSSCLNKPVLEFLQDYSAHSDVTEALLQSVNALGDVQRYCPVPSQYRYFVVSTRTVIFGIAIGMNTVAFRLSSPYNQRAVTTGGSAIPGLGEEWISFTLFRDDWPEADLSFWARKAYVYARETKTL